MRHDWLIKLPLMRKLRTSSANNLDSEFHSGHIRPISLCVHLQCVELDPLRPEGSWYLAGPRGEDPNPRGFIISGGSRYGHEAPYDSENGVHR